MNQNIFSFLKKYTDNILSINRLVISAFVSMNKLPVSDWSYIAQYVINESDNEEYDSLQKFISILGKSTKKITIENIIELFEFVISPADKIVNGAVYTPQNIRKYIVDEVVRNIGKQNWTNLKVADISCGCGGFFITFIDAIRNLYGFSCYDLYKNTIYGVDIQEYSIERCKILLVLYALANGEDHKNFKFNLYKGNSLEFNWRENIEYYDGFDAIIGNPPYVSSSKISDESKSLLDRWSVSKTGKSDLYIPFFQIALENLKDDGILGYITVNNFYRSLNGRAFRQYLSERLYDLKLIDFASEQIFKNRSTYTCLCFITISNNGHIHYIQRKSSEIHLIRDIDYIDIDYDNVSDSDGWILKNNNIMSIISRIEKIGTPLGKLINIRNGFATLKNEIFILNVIAEDDSFYYTKTKDKNEFKIEKSICKDAIKPNVLKSEEQIARKIEKLIFPYHFTEGNAIIIDEKELTLKYPCTYQYFLHFKNDLANRDKGKRTYEKWYAFGRSQAINIKGYKLLFPYIADKPYFVLTEQKDLLFYNGYALVSDSIRDLKVIRKILKSELFWFYVRHVSKPYGGNYFALAKNYVKNFGVVDLTEDQKDFLLELDDNMVDSYLTNLYDVDLDVIK